MSTSDDILAAAFSSKGAKKIKKCFHRWRRVRVEMMMDINRFNRGYLQHDSNAFFLQLVNDTHQDGITAFAGIIRLNWNLKTAANTQSLTYAGVDRRWLGSCQSRQTIRCLAAVCSQLKCSHMQRYTYFHKRLLTIQLTLEESSYLFQYPSRSYSISRDRWHPSHGIPGPKLKQILRNKSNTKERALLLSLRLRVTTTSNTCLSMFRPNCVD